MSTKIGWDFILIDTSASMIVNGGDMKKGIKDLFSKQIKDGSNNKLSIYTFNTVVTKIGDYYFPNPPDIESIDLNCYCKTAIIDTIGCVYDDIIKQRNEYSLISVNIITDGIENSSNKYTTEDLLNKRLQILKNNELVINFIGADETCLDDCGKYNVNTSQNCNGDFVLAFRSLSDTLSSQRSPSYSPPQSEYDFSFGIKRNLSPISTSPPSQRIKIDNSSAPRRVYTARELETPPPLVRSTLIQIKK
jgi:hypothetical protein